MRESVAEFGDALSGVAEWQLVPSVVVGTHTLHVYQILFARRTRAEPVRLAGEHSIFLIMAPRRNSTLNPKSLA